MAIELVTGRTGSPHVHSHDVRQLHRGIFGQDKYRLIDRENCIVTVSPGSVQIADGGIIWNGMHIRHWKDNPYTYASPASTQTVGVYLHYTKDTEGIENVEFKVYVGSAAPATKDNFGDNDLEAYTLFYSFTHNSNGSISNGSYKFPLVQPSSKLEKEVYQKINRLFERKELATNVKAGASVTLKENINNFAYFEILTEGAYAKYPVADFDSVMRASGTDTRITIPMGSSDTGRTVPYSGFRNLHIKLSGTTFKYVKGNTFVLNADGIVTKYDNPVILKIYGVQRVN